MKCVISLRLLIQQGRCVGVLTTEKRNILAREKNHPLGSKLHELTIEFNNRKRRECDESLFDNEVININRIMLNLKAL